MCRIHGGANVRRGSPVLAAPAKLFGGFSRTSLLASFELIECLALTINHRQDATVKDQVGYVGKKRKKRKKKTVIVSRFNEKLSC